MQQRSSMTMIAPEPSIEPASAIALASSGVSSWAAARTGTPAPPGMTAFSCPAAGVPSERPARPRLFAADVGAGAAEEHDRHPAEELRPVHLRERVAEDLELA